MIAKNTSVVPQDIVIGIDIGGTFTDVFAAGSNGFLVAGKADSTPPEYQFGVLEALGHSAKSAGLDTYELLRRTRYVIHGTTTALNALVTGDVARVGLLTTRGHRDAISIMNLEGRYLGLARDQIQDIVRSNKPSPLLEQDLVEEIDERIDCEGKIVVPLNELEARAQIRALLSRGVTAMAVCLLWSFANDRHERRVRELIAESAPSMDVSISSEVTPRVREYSRAVTTVMNSQVIGKLMDYIGPLEGDLRSAGFSGSLLVMQGSGGSVLASESPRLAINSIGSVLAGGVIGCGNLGRALQHTNIVATDMGGTTFLVGLIVDGVPSSRTTTVVNQYRVNLPMLDVRSIGNGGGTVAWVDEGKGLHVGPRSAGARPGPACYDEGGNEPTITDVDLVRGILRPEAFLAGSRHLRPELARKAVRERIALPLGLSVEEAAAAIAALHESQATTLIRRVLADGGHDPRDFALYCYGGAGPSHFAEYALDLEFPEVVVPLGPVASVFSAFGLAGSSMGTTAEGSRPSPFPVAASVANALFEQLECQARTELVRQGADPDRIETSRAVDVRYSLQMAELEVLVPPGELSIHDLNEVCKSFDELYERRYGSGTGFREAGRQVMTYRVYAQCPLPAGGGLMERRPEATLLAQPHAPDSRRVLMRPEGDWEIVPVQSYRDLRPHATLRGPCVVEADMTTVCIPREFQAAVDDLGNLRIRLRELTA